ncbi:CBY1-interacting BAR domain-containing protein 1 isoform X2 [Diabrotica undecimpunctata]|uniref:CBY1-interacting BAR domain-containing protein 1 isoform X2 n=1 Tax=Diabrotica undecimpunctata TaxID=50387 RepID=UPI003B63647A
MSQISDYEDVRVQGIDIKVVSQFMKYENICKQAKDEVKDIYTARDKEVSKKRYLDRIRERNPRNRQQIIQAETELVKATAEVSKSIQILEEKTNTFEKQKLHDIKAILLDFMFTEIGYHAKCLEILTKGYNEVQAINEETDLEEFKKSLRIPNQIQEKTFAKSSIFRSTGSLGSLGALFSSNQNRKAPGIPNAGDKMYKSEETLDSIKHSISDSEDESDSKSVDTLSSSSEEKQSPTVVRVRK